MTRSTRLLRPIPLAAALLMAAMLPLANVHAQGAGAQALVIEIPAQPAAAALQRLVEQTGYQLLFSPELVRGINAKSVSGSLTPREALRRLLDGSGLVIVDTGNNSATLQRKSEVSSLDAVFVTARKKDERMLDVPIAVTAITGEGLLRRGATSVTEVLQDAPGVSSYDRGMGAEDRDPRHLHLAGCQRERLLPRRSALYRRDRAHRT